MHTAAEGLAAPCLFARHEPKEGGHEKRKQAWLDMHVETESAPQKKRDRSGAPVA